MAKPVTAMVIVLLVIAVMELVVPRHKNVMRLVVIPQNVIVILIVLMALFVPEMSALTMVPETLHVPIQAQALCAETLVWGLLTGAAILQVTVSL